jgi:uracil-DNA glycosylase
MLVTRYVDAPYTLADPAVRAERLRLLEAPRVVALTEFVNRIRRERGLHEEIPFFDPLDGGTAARCLCLMEAPGRKAVQSGFISRNNPDPSARNSFGLYRDAGLQRADTVLWNIVPWYIGSDGGVRPAREEDIAAGLAYLGLALDLLPSLEIVVLLGRKAQRASTMLSRLRPRLKVLACPHPSPLFINHEPGNRAVILRVLQSAAAELNNRGSSGEAPTFRGSP